MAKKITIEEQLSPKVLYHEMQHLRDKKGLDITLSQYLKDERDGMSIDAYYSKLEINPAETTVQLILDRDEDQRWLVPEIFRDAIRKGYLNEPIFQDLVIRDEAVVQPSIVMPYWDLTGLNNAPADMGPAESFTLGTLKYGQKTVKVRKSGIGIELADEAIQYTNISLLSLFLQDVGAKLGSSLGTKAIGILISGEQQDGSEAAAVVGCSTAGTMVYDDFIRMFVRSKLRNRQWTRVVGNEATINYMLDMPEFRNTNKFANPELGLNLKTPIARNVEAYVHSAVPNNQLIMLDPNFAMVQLTAQPLKVEADRIVARQVNQSFASLTTGFAIVFSDGRCIMDRSLDYATHQFPASLTPLF